MFQQKEKKLFLVIKKAAVSTASRASGSYTL